MVMSWRRETGHAQKKPASSEYESIYRERERKKRNLSPVIGVISTYRDM